MNEVELKYFNYPFNKTEYKSLEHPLNDQQDNRIIVCREYLEELKRTRRELWLKQQKVIALIKDGRFVEALQELEK